ncbi:4-hydroxybenzoate octaprenyltransferase [Aurantiacibacter aquimixticola]|uniref:4-hydroxybenzoate octaprenyltransferase n=1 Tax=Aurantiacibacter aquimixticola TaxID=1958945 RepID=A0A419RQE4_9SPHN|nr:4-hydroxybenzoate octaprenyltransferase [Aurantiacibacter aquimixticola]RJY08028.1 4-hydroxybenzoate octaprenyltransferase [Aurantiacibacter aquimixticola]
MTAETITPDSQHKSLAERLPQPLRDYALLGRFDRPIGWWLLFWPCAWGVWLTGAGFQWALIGWLLLGAIAMRAAGCVYNDIVDADLDRRVARTAARPIASGRVSKRAAWGWLVTLCLIGLVVLLQLRLTAQLVALGSLAMVTAYPFMKRITWWPQAWLGLVFNWGVLVGWTALRADNLGAMLALYAGAVFWTVGYDTIYALQDREDDALVGIKSSALRLGGRVKAGVAMFYALAIGLWAFAFWLLRSDVVALLALAPAALHLFWQVATLDIADPDNPLARFRSNRLAGALVAAACFVVGNAGG